MIIYGDRISPYMPDRITDGPREPGDVMDTDRRTSEHALQEEQYDIERQEEADELPALMRDQIG